MSEIIDIKLSELTDSLPDGVYNIITEFFSLQDGDGYSIIAIVKGEKTILSDSGDMSFKWRIRELEPLKQNDINPVATCWLEIVLEGGEMRAEIETKQIVFRVKSFLQVMIVLDNMRS